MIRRYCDAGACRERAAFVVKYPLGNGLPASAAACSAEHRRVIVKDLKLTGCTWFKLPPLQVPHLSSSQAMVFETSKARAKQMGNTEIWGD